MTPEPSPGSSSAATPPADQAADSLRQWLRSLPVFPAALPPLDVAALPAAPDELFLQWLREVAAAGQLAARVMTLATSGDDGDGGRDVMPAARNVLLTDLDEHGWQFATHASSPKGQALAAHPFAAAAFFWPTLGRQVRLAGPVRRLSADAAARDFQERSETSRASILIGRPSDTLAGPDAYRADFDRARKTLHDHPDLIDADWAVYALAPERVEFWQGSTTGPQSRVLYQRAGDSWAISTLYP